MASVRSLYMDLSKGFGIMMIIIGHHYCEPVLKDWIYSFHVPMFFIVSGYFYKTDSSLGKNFAQLLRPYFLTVFIVLLYFLFFQIMQMTLKGLPFYYKQFVDIFLSNATGGFIPKGAESAGIIGLWFLMALFVVKLFMRVISAINSVKWQFIVVVFIFCMGYYMSNIYQMRLPFFLLQSMTCLVFVWIGHLIKRYKTLDVLSSSGCMLISGVVLLFVAFLFPINTVSVLYPYHFLSAAISCVISISFIVVLKKISELERVSAGKVVGLVNYYGRYSLVILCFHGIESSMQLSKYLCFIPECFMGLFKVVLLGFVPLVVRRIPYLNMCFGCVKK